jgi:hypothetical protein
MRQYRAYLMENGHVWMANLPSGHDVELWQGDRKVALLRLRKRSSTEAYSAVRRQHSKS